MALTIKEQELVNQMMTDGATDQEIQTRLSNARAFNAARVPSSSISVPTNSATVSTSNNNVKQNLDYNAMMQKAQQEPDPNKRAMLIDSIKKSVPKYGNTEFRTDLTPKPEQTLREASNEQLNQAGSDIRNGNVVEGVKNTLGGALKQTGATAEDIGKFLFNVATAPGAALDVLSQGQETHDKNVQKIAQGVSNAMSVVTDAPGGQDVKRWYDSLSPDMRKNVDAAVNIGLFATSFIPAGGEAATGISKAGQAVSDLTKVAAEKAGELGAKAAEVVKTGLAERAYNASKAVVDQTPERLAAIDAQIKDVGGKILQAKKPSEIKRAAESLGNVDISGVQTADDLGHLLQEKTTAILKDVDNRLAVDTTPRKIADFTENATVKVGNQTSTAQKNYLQSALQDMRQVYKDSGDIENLARIDSTGKKLADEGLTLQEANNLAKEYGTTFKDKAFNKDGTPKTGVSSEAYENTRSGLKGSIRRLSNDKTIEALDKQAGNLIKTQKTIDKVIQGVQNINNKLKKRGIIEKVGGAVGSAAATTLDLVTGGTLKGFISRLIPSNVGLKTMNYLDIEKALNSNLKKLQKLLKEKSVVKSTMEKAKAKMDKIKPTESSGFNQAGSAESANNSALLTSSGNSARLFTDINANGGITIDLKTMKSAAGEPMLSIGAYPSRSLKVQKSKFTPGSIADYIEKNKDLLSESGNHLGGWVDGNDVWLDVAVLVNKSKQKLAEELGKKLNQKSIFDLENFKEIQTGGTGENIKEMSTSQIKKFLGF